jgi:predicted aconitase
MFHIPGVTPEAALADPAIGREVTVTQADLDAVYDAAGRVGDPVDLVVFSAPQLSLFELRRLAGLFGGRRVASRTTVIVTTNAMTRTAAQAAGCLDAIEDAGALVLQGTCWYVMDPAAMRDAFGWGRLVTNSAKLVNIVKAHGYEPVLRSTERCVAAALDGEIPAR